SRATATKRPWPWPAKPGAPGSAASCDSWSSRKKTRPQALYGAWLGVFSQSLPNDPDIAVAARDLERTFHIGENRIDVLRGVSLEVRRGETLFLVGPSGAGKTSLLYTLAGLERPNAGEVLINGRSLYSLSRREQARV